MQDARSWRGGTGWQPVPVPASPLDWHRRGRFIPHRENKRLQAITWRLFDSLPADVVAGMRAELASLQSVPDTPETAARHAELRKSIDRYEDAGHGSCFLEDGRIARIVADNLRHFDGTRYRLLSCCIMPNHVHVLVEVAEGWSLSRLLHGWRSYTANEANKVLGRTGRFWMEEYYDRFIRDGDHLRSVLSYIRMNPVKAGLSADPESWPWSWEAKEAVFALEARAGSPCSQVAASPGAQAASLCVAGAEARAGSPCSQGALSPGAQAASLCAAAAGEKGAMS